MLSLLVGLIVILNPLTTVPAYVSMYPDVSQKQRVRDAFTVAVGVCIVLACAALLGEGMLMMFGLDIEYFRIAGGCVIGRVARNLAQGNIGIISVSDKKLQSHKKRTIDKGLIIPLVIPMTAGPGSIAYIVSQSTGHNIFSLLLVAVIASTVVYVALRYGSVVIDKLGDTGISVMTRIIGIILLGISLQMIIGTILTLV